MPRVRPAMLICPSTSGAEEYIPLDEEVTTIGRSERCDVVLPYSTVSRLHARVVLEHDRYILYDAGSANGTYLNGELIAGGRQLSTADEIWLGSHDVTLGFSDPDETLGVTLHSGPPSLFIDESARIVKVYGLPVQLTTLEYDLLHYLASHPRYVCTREECFLAVWGQPYDHATCEDALNACIARLRRNLRAAAEASSQPPPQITTIKRIGFRLDSEVVLTTTPQSPTLRERAISM
jgi:DNA-binding winged helix-turn-helix (wHTH) protein